MTTKPVAKTAPVRLETDDGVLAQLKAMGFSDDYVATPRRLIVSSAGREKTGKTHWALTAPDPIIMLNVDVGTEGVVGKFQQQGKRVFIYEVRVPREGTTKDTYQAMWQDVKSRIRRAYDLKMGTVVWDSATEIYELARLSHFGKLTQVLPHNYVEVNNEWRELLRLAYDSTINTVFIHKMKPKWVNNARTGDYEISGFGEMDYLAQVNLIHYREAGDGGPEFNVFVKDCRQNPQISGEMLRASLHQNTFDFLLDLVHG